MQINQRLDVNGSDSKPFPQERNFVMNPDAYTDQVGQGRTVVPQTDHNNVANTFGQIKYAKRAGAMSIYKDETRNTANDNAASRKTESEGCADNYEENQGI